MIISPEAFEALANSYAQNYKDAYAIAKKNDSNTSVLLPVNFDINDKVVPANAGEEVYALLPAEAIFFDSESNPVLRAKDEKDVYIVVNSAMNDLELDSKYIVLKEFPLVVSKDLENQLEEIAEVSSVNERDEMWKFLTEYVEQGGFDFSQTSQTSQDDSQNDSQDSETSEDDSEDQNSDEDSESADDSENENTDEQSVEDQPVEMMSFMDFLNAGKQKLSDFGQTELGDNLKTSFKGMFVTNPKSSRKIKQKAKEKKDSTSKND